MSATEDITAMVFSTINFVSKLSSLTGKRNPGNEVAKEYIRSQSSPCLSVVVLVKGGLWKFPDVRMLIKESRRMCFYFAFGPFTGHLPFKNYFRFDVLSRNCTHLDLLPQLKTSLRLRIQVSCQSRFAIKQNLSKILRGLIIFLGVPLGTIFVAMTPPHPTFPTL